MSINVKKLDGGQTPVVLPAWDPMGSLACSHCGDESWLSKSERHIQRGA